MLSDQAAALLAALVYRPDAEWRVNIIPFGSIFCNDEMPVLADLLERPDDMSIIHTMFALRLQLWDGEVLNAPDQMLWDGVKRQVPNWALFQRLTLSANQQLARQEAERQVQQAFESFGGEPDGAE
ncbi:MAG TPA: hypothetical protein VNW47_07175 [Terriglobales bacterium]|jgi:hypothetical protein|nr:hypothetical protein [Terriglobales bacterium]